jgi:hypothetical protein
MTRFACSAHARLRRDLPKDVLAPVSCFELMNSSLGARCSRHGKAYCRSVPPCCELLVA